MLGLNGAVVDRFDILGLARFRLISCASNLLRSVDSVLLQLVAHVCAFDNRFALRCHFVLTPGSPCGRKLFFLCFLFLTLYPHAVLQAGHLSSHTHVRSGRDEQRTSR
jgi:hypothetical protein